MNKKTFWIAAKIAAGFATCLGTAAAQEIKASAALKMEPKLFDFAGTRRAGKMYMPSSVELSAEKPKFVTHEPAYRSTPKYAVVVLGNGPRAKHAIAIDAPDGEDAKIYVDLDGDGDLAKATDLALTKTKTDRGIEYSGTYLFRVSFGNATKENTYDVYGLNFYWTSTSSQINYYRASARVGQIKLGNENYKVTLIEENNNGLYNTPYRVASKPTKPVWLVLDGTSFDARGTFPLAGRNYQALVSPDGSKLTLQSTSRSITPPSAAAQTREPELLAVGTMAPDFEVPAYGGGTVRLSSLRGKIVVLDFWATWCGPCKASLPHVQKIYEKLDDKNVHVLALCVFDDKSAYDQWIPANSQYKFQFAYDPAGRDASSIAKSKYNVSGIPTTYVIDANGKIAAAIIGFSGLDDHRLEQALAKLGVPIEAPAEKKAIPMTSLGG